MALSSNAFKSSETQTAKSWEIFDQTLKSNLSRRMIISLCEEKRQSEKVLINMQVERVKEKKISSKTSSVEFYSELFAYSLIFPF